VIAAKDLDGFEGLAHRRHVVVLAGSGISTDQPSGLLSWRDFNQAVLDAVTESAVAGVPTSRGALPAPACEWRPLPAGGMPRPPSQRPGNGSQLRPKAFRSLRAACCARSRPSRSTVALSAMALNARRGSDPSANYRPPSPPSQGPLLATQAREQRYGGGKQAAEELIATAYLAYEHTHP
jgi:hypothetical protein